MSIIITLDIDIDIPAEELTGYIEDCISNGYGCNAECKVVGGNQ